MGGEDIDNRMVQHFADEFRRKYKLDPRESKKSTRRLKIACERAKCILSTSAQAAVEVDSLYEGMDLFSSISRARFEQLAQDVFRDCLSVVDKVIKQAGLEAEDVDEVVLSGGSAKIPKLQQMLSDYFGGKELNKSINPDEAIAFGAAVQASLLCDDAERKAEPM